MLRKCMILIIISCCGLFLSGCTKSNYVNPDPNDANPAPDFNIYDDYELDMDQLLYDVLDVGLDQDFYPMAEGIDFGLHLEENFVAVAAIVKDDTNMEDALWYGSEALKVVNDQVANQDLTYELSSVDSYGGLYNENDAHLDIYYASAFENDEAPFASFDIPAGTYMVLEPDAES